jgi:hypothetical protein
MLLHAKWLFFLIAIDILFRSLRGRLPVDLPRKAKHSN